MKYNININYFLELIFFSDCYVKHCCTMNYDKECSRQQVAIHDLHD